MDGRNRTIVTLPNELIELVRLYQSDRKLASFNAALVELLEMSPGIATTLDRVYSALNQAHD